MGKRLFDLFFSGLGLLALGPLLLLIALAVKLDSPGPVFFRQERVGRHGRVFRIHKFRTMSVRPAGEGLQITVGADARITRSGHFLRATKLDELAQLLDVLLGDMSLVGPRPERPVFIAQFRKTIPNYMARHSVKAGITGWAQVNGWRGDTSLTRRIECDLYYIRHWSYWLDCKILWLTLWRGFIHKNAY